MELYVYFDVSKCGQCLTAVKWRWDSVWFREIHVFVSLCWMKSGPENWQPVDSGFY